MKMKQKKSGIKKWENSKRKDRKKERTRWKLERLQRRKKGLRVKGKEEGEYGDEGKEKNVHRLN